MLDRPSIAIGREFLGQPSLRRAAEGTNGRLHHLDAVRGIAAFVVVVHHALLCVPSGHGILGIVDRLPGLRILSLGRPAVILFFVLSGFVLGRALEARPTKVALFAARRCVRLLPAYWVAILLSFVGYGLVQRHTAANMTEWFNAQWGGGGIPVSELLGHLGMHAGPRQFSLDHVAWSLVHEIRLSIFLPLLVLAYRRFGLTACLLAAAVVASGVDVWKTFEPTIFPAGLHGFLFDAPQLLPSLALTARFGLDFAVGFALVARWASIEAVFARSPRLRGVALVTALVLLSTTNEAAMACGAALLIASVASSEAAASLLGGCVLTWLGRVSYSLYLIHLPIMLVCGLALGTCMPPALAIALAVVIALPMAEMLYRLVEAPSIRWSRAIGQARAKTPAVSPEPLLAAA